MPNKGRNVYVKCGKMPDKESNMAKKDALGWNLDCGFVRVLLCTSRKGEYIGAPLFSGKSLRHCMVNIL